MPGKPLVIEAVGVEAVGRAHEAAEVDAAYSRRAPAPCSR